MAQATANVNGATATKTRTVKIIRVDAPVADDAIAGISSVNMPGAIYNGLVAAAAKLPGAVKDGVLVTGFIAKAVRAGLGQAYAPGFDIAAWEEAQDAKRNASRGAAGSQRGQKVTTKAKLLDNVLGDADMLRKIMELQASGMSPEEMIAALSAS